MAEGGEEEGEVGPFDERPQMLAPPDQRIGVLPSPRGSTEQRSVAVMPPQIEPEPELKPIDEKRMEVREERQDSAHSEVVQEKESKVCVSDIFKEHGVIVRDFAVWKVNPFIQ